MHKIGHVVAGEWIAHRFERVYRMPANEDELRRITAGITSDGPSVLAKLAESVTAPYFLLYVLHTTRGEGDLGRYQSPEVGLDDLHELLARYARFLASDSRFDLWIHSPEDRATLVWDRHDQLFAYGPLERIARELEALGYSQGDVVVPRWHSHHYWEANDAAARDLLARHTWRRTPLEPADVQFVED